MQLNCIWKHGYKQKYSISLPVGETQSLLSIIRLLACFLFAGREASTNSSEINYQNP